MAEGEEDRTTTAFEIAEEENTPIAQPVNTSRASQSQGSLQNSAHAADILTHGQLSFL
jgi:hypothetical protein